MRTIEEIKADIASAKQPIWKRQFENELYKALTSDIPLDRLEEICAAEKDGRLVVLPCKVGDTVFTIGNVRCSDCPHGEGNYSAYLHCHQPECPKAVLEHICEGYEIGQNGLSNPGEWGYEGLETFALPDDSGSGCYYARAEAEKTLGKEHGHDE